MTSSILNMMLTIWKDKISYFPSFRLDSLMTPAKIKTLMNVKLTSTKFSRRIQKAKSNLPISLKKYDQIYKQWLSGGSKYLSDAFKLVENIHTTPIEEITFFCNKVNNFFDTYYGYPILLKNYLDDHLSQSIKKKLLDKDDIYIYTTPSMQSAYVVIYFMQSLALENEPCYSFLLNNVYLHEKHMNIELKTNQNNCADMKLLRDWYQKYLLKKQLSSKHLSALYFDNLLNRDHFDETILWHISNHRIPLISLYTHLQDFVCKHKSNNYRRKQIIDVDQLETSVKNIIK